MTKNPRQTDKRDLKLDAMKGFAILLVVVGHSIQINSFSGFDQNIFYRIIYSFHMPLFFFLSGAVASLSKKAFDKKLIKNKFLSLMIPFAAWYLISYIVVSTRGSVDAWKYVSAVIVHPDNGLWFLWVLFISYCLLVLIKKLEKHIGLWSYLIVWLLFTAIPTTDYGIGLVAWFLPFFLLGYLVFTYQKQLSKYKKYIYTACAVGFPILVLSWYRLSIPQYLVSLGQLMTHSRYNLVSISPFIKLNLYDLVIFLYRYLVPLTGIGLTLLIFEAKMSRRFIAALAFLGTRTIDIYVMNEYFVGYAIGGDGIKVITGVVFAVVMALLISTFVIRRFKITNRILLGGRA